MIETLTHTPLRDAMYAMSLAKPVPDAELLDEYVRLYPEHAEALTEFAVELAVDALLHDADQTDFPEHPEAVSPVVSRVMSRFQNRLFEVQRGHAAAAPAARAAATSVENPFVALDRDQFRALAGRINVNTVILSKLRDRQIDPDTIPGEFCRRIADELGEPLGIITTHLFASQDTSHARQFFKSDGKPTAASQQSFEQAVRGSGLTHDQQRRLLSFGH
ncbi:MAG: hypothetical protein QOJ84_2176 [Bradyrhizobium sp.]|jgi:hypothetical protein|nr:hypothetical protein [Bradyrhizobium sp.]